MSQEIDLTDNVPDELASKNKVTPMPSGLNAVGPEPQPVLKAQVVTKKPFTERMKTHRLFVVRAVYYIFYSVWAVVMAIGMFIAWLIAMLFI